MGKGFFDSWNNETTSTFNGWVASKKCVYHLERITGEGVLPPGTNQEYLEDKDSGTCYVELNNYYIVGYALPNTQPGHANFALGYSSGNTDLNLKGKAWHKKTKKWDHYRCFMWTLTDGFSAQLDSFGPHGAQCKYEWHVSPPQTRIGDTEAAQVSAPVELDVPEDGSDYQGPPKSPAGG